MSAIGFAILGTPEARTGLVLAGTVCSVTAMLWRPIRRWLPERACQVSDAPLRSSSRERMALSWGFRLGLGVCTFLVTPAFYAFLVASIVLPSIHGFITGVIYGLTRGGTITTLAIAQSHRTRRLHRDVDVRFGNSFAIPLVVTVLVASALSVR